MKHFEKSGISTVEANAILTTFKNDVRLATTRENFSEYWIGEKGTTTLKMLICYDDGKSDYFSLGKTASELRKDVLFFKALLTDGEISHEICLYDSYDDAAYKNIIKWVSGETNEIPADGCVVINYYSYLG